MYFGYQIHQIFQDPKHMVMDFQEYAHMYNCKIKSQKKFIIFTILILIMNIKNHKKNQHTK